MIESLISLDEQLFIYLNNNWRAASLDRFMFFISENGFIFSSLLVGFALLMLKFHWKKVLFCLVGVAANIGIIDLLISRVIKPGFERFRPTHTPMLQDLVMTVNDNNGNSYRGGLYGFASGHAATTMVAAVLIILIFGKTQKWVFAYLIWSILISYSRIYLGVHFPLDIICGWMISAFFATVFYFFICKELIIKGYLD